MRIALVLLLAIFGQLALGADILIFVYEKEAGPTVPSALYRHPTWILWPQSSDLLQSNRLLSLPSGVDWQSGPSEETFVVADRSARNPQPRPWEDKGFFEAVRRNLSKREVFALAPKDSKVSPSTLESAWTRADEIPILRRADNWPGDGLVVATVTGRNPWDEKAALVQKAGGRAMIVEIPTSPFTMWSRVWLEGRGWPEGLPRVKGANLPGLIFARDAMSMLSNPVQTQWVATGLPDPPDRWLVFGHETTPIILVFLAVASLYVLGLSVFYVLREQYSRLALWLLRLMVLSPAALVVGGRLTAVGSVSNWPMWHLAAFAGAAVLATAVNALAARLTQDSHPLWGEFAVGLFAVAAIDPAWSMFSNVLGQHPAKISPEAFGALATYAVGASCLFGGRRWISAVWSVFWVACVAALLYVSAWVPVSPDFLAILAIPLLQPLIHDTKLLATFASFFVLLNLASSKGVTYAPSGLISNLQDEERINLADHVGFFLSPMFIGFAIAVVIVVIAGDNFLGHQVRRALAFSPKPKSFLFAAATFGVVGILSPIYLHAALATAIAGGVTVLFDAVRTP